jgi:hypothetical protein
LVHKSDLTGYLTKDNINNLSEDNEKNLLLTKNDILNLPEENEGNEKLKLIIKKDILTTPSSENKISTLNSAIITVKSHINTF